MLSDHKRLSALPALAALVAIGSFLLFMNAPVGAQDDADNPDQLEAGMAVFEASCAVCHGSDGTGITGRDLTDIALEQPDRNVHITSVTDGVRTMPSFGDSLSADEIDAVVSYVRISFATAQDDDAANDAADPAPEEELAVTGVETSMSLIAASFLVAVGLLLLQAARMSIRIRA